MTKFIRVTMPNGEQWEVPASMVISARAEYYANVESRLEEKSYQKIYEEEYNNALSDNSLIIEWARNNFNWDDVESVAYKISPPAQLTKKQKQEAWMNGPMDVVSKA